MTLHLYKLTEKRETHKHEHTHKGQKLKLYEHQVVLFKQYATVQDINFQNY